jgi:hypothetical protein
VGDHVYFQIRFCAVIVNVRTPAAILANTGVMKELAIER